LNWKIEYSKQALKFSKKHKLLSEVGNEIKNFLQRINGKTIPLDVKQLKGNWEGYFRIRKEKIRIIFLFDKENKIIYIDKIDFRSDAYK